MMVLLGCVSQAGVGGGGRIWTMLLFPTGMSSVDLVFRCVLILFVDCYDPGMCRFKT